MIGVRFGLIVCVVVAAAGVFGQLALHWLDENAHTGETVIARLELQADRLHSWDQRAVNDQSAPAELPLIESRAEDAMRGAQVLRQVTSDPAAAAFASALANYRVALDAEMREFERGDMAAATLLQAEQAAPRYKEVAAALPAAQAALRMEREQSSWLAAAGSVFTLLGTLATTSLLVLRIERSRRATELSGEARFRGLVQNATDLVAILDTEGTFRYASPAAEALLGLAPDALVGHPLLAYAHPEDRPLVRYSFELAQATPRTNFTELFRVYHHDGSIRHVEATWRDLQDEQSIAGIVLNVRDVSERKVLEDQLEHRAFHDGLTELPNRARLVDSLRDAVRADARRRAAVVFIDLDDFKVVNDSLGHDRGDQLLVAVAQSLRATVRSSDLVARLGGDEFIVLVDELDTEADAVDAAERCRAQFASPFMIDGREVFIGASIGVAMSGPEVSHPDELLRRADLAMYAAKARGKSQIAVFEPALDMAARERLELEADLRRALERDELRLRYQPIVDLRTGHIRGVEALLRWQHHERGLIAPDQFIPLAEETGLIVPIGRWVLQAAARQVRVWQTQQRGGEALSLSVNISGRQFQHPGLIDDVADALRVTGLAPGDLVLEITESVAMSAGEATIETLQALKGLGVQLALDDFGTGYSSLSYLKAFPVDNLKIDRSFVDGLGHDEQDTAIVRSIVAIAGSLGLSVTAEGIETPDQLRELQALGCDDGQGFLFARPEPELELAHLLERGLLGSARDVLSAA